MFKIVEDYFVKSGVGSMYSSTPSTGKSSARKPKCELPVEPNMSKQKMHSAAKAMTVNMILRMKFFTSLLILKTPFIIYSNWFLCLSEI